jgi:hypothetical protein
MKKLLFGVIALPLLTGVALAQKPVQVQKLVQLSDAQMDKVTAGHILIEEDEFNTLETNLFVNTTGPTPGSPCSACAVDIRSAQFSLQAQFIPHFED